jgi:diguanylate cyclase (GGDEF)-like protein
MPETAMSQRAWRLDRLGSSSDATQRVRDSEAGLRPGEAELGSHWAAGVPNSQVARPVARLSRIVRDWLLCRGGRKRLSHEQFENLVHRFAASIDQTDDPDVVEVELLRVVRQLAPSSRIELVPEESSHNHGVAGDPEGSADTTAVHEPSQRVLEIPLRCGASICARLQIRPRTGGPSSYRIEDVRRMTTLGTMAACAMEGLGLFTEWPQNESVRLEVEKSPGADRPRAEVHRPPVHLEDATFLNAVLPFALGQARRHREPLSILCVAVDRLSAIKQLLGQGESDRLVQHVARTVGAMIRASDILARLDDDRIVAVLPRAPRGGAMHVAENICRAVQVKSPEGWEGPSVTVSIGVATYPSCAENVYSLFDAADEALACAQRNGRSQAVMARPRPLSVAADPSLVRTLEDANILHAT